MLPERRRAGRAIRKARRYERWLREVMGVEVMPWQLRALRLEAVLIVGRDLRAVWRRG